MKRAALGIVAVALLIGIPMTAGTASATPPNKTTITLTCDRGTASSGLAVKLTDSVGGPAGGTTLTCGPDSTSDVRMNRVVLMTSVSADAVTIDNWTWSTTSGSGSCVTTHGTLPFKMSCTDSNGVGSSVVVR